MNEHAKKLIDNEWAIDAPGNRQTAEEVGVDRRTGWNLDYEQAGTNKFPQRTLFNELLYQYSSAFNEHMKYGTIIK